MASKESWTGWIVFAGFVIIIVGVMDVLQGFVAILEDEYVVATTKGLAIVDVTTWGWVTLIWGGLSDPGRPRLLGVPAGTLLPPRVGLNAFKQVAFLANYPHAYPFWNILIVTLSFLVLYALTARWQASKPPCGTSPDRLSSDRIEGARLLCAPRAANCPRHSVRLVRLERAGRRPCRRRAAPGGRRPG